MKRLFLYSFVLILCFSINADSQMFQIPEEKQKVYSAVEFFPAFVGEWKSRMVILDNIEENYANGNSTITLELNSRYLLIKNFIVHQSGFPIEFWSIIGYNVFEDNYFLFLLDNFSGFDLYLTGLYSKKEQKFTFDGLGFDSKSKKKIPVRVLIYFERKDKFWFEYYTKDKSNYKLYYKIMFIQQNK